MSKWGYCRVGIFNSVRKQKDMPTEEGSFPKMGNYGTHNEFVSKIIRTKSKSNAVIVDVCVPQFGRKPS